MYTSLVCMCNLSSVQSLSHVRLFVTPWTAAHQASLSTNSRSLLKLMSIELVMALIHGPDIPGSYAILLFTASDLVSITSHIHSWVLVCFGSIPSFFLELFLH